MLWSSLAQLRPTLQLPHRREVLPMVCKDWAAASAIPSELWRQASSCTLVPLCAVSALTVLQLEES